MTVIRILFAFVLLMVPPAWAQAKGVALVIGNAAYSNVTELDNPVNDATSVATALRLQGFEVREGIDLNRQQMRNALRDFRRLADGADVALVYYAGHGIEIAGVNYLVPVDARLEDERDAGLEMVEVDLILRQISGAKQLKMVVLDACRNNPFVVKMQRENAGRNVGNGLGRVSVAQPDTLIAYAAAAGEITPDGEPGSNSPFTQAFVNALSGPPADVRRLLGRARDELRQSVPGAAPFVYTSLGGGEMVINPLIGQRPEPAPAPATKPEGSISTDFVRIDRSGTLEDWNAFLVKWESQSDHPLYAFALEEREALKDAQPPRSSGSAETESIAAAPKPDPVPDPVPEPASPARTPDEAARALQQVMKDRGCYRGAIDGILGRGSQRGLATFSGEIGKDLAMPDRDDATEIDALIAVFEAHPGTDCPAVTVRTTPTKPKSTATAPRAQPAKSQPAQTQAAPSGDTQIQGSNATTRKNSNKLAPVVPSDCIGSRAKFYDCP